MDHVGARRYVERRALLGTEVYTVLATPGVAQASKYIARFSQWKRPDGRQESVQVVGFDPDQQAWRTVESGRAARRTR